MFSVCPVLVPFFFFQIISQTKQPQTDPGCLHCPAFHDNAQFLYKKCVPEFGVFLIALFLKGLLRENLFSYSCTEMFSSWHSLSKVVQGGAIKKLWKGQCD